LKKSFVKKPNEHSAGWQKMLENEFSPERQQSIPASVL
jgi:hypothetical protein